MLLFLGSAFSAEWLPPPTPNHTNHQTDRTGHVRHGARTPPTRRRTGGSESGAAGEGAQQGGKKKRAKRKGHSARKADGRQREKDGEALSE